MSSENRPNSARFSKRDSQAKEQTEQKDDYEYEEAVSENENELNNDNQNQTCPDENENENDDDEYEDDDDEEEILIPAGWKVGLSKCKRKFFYNDYNKDKVLVSSFFVGFLISGLFIF